MSNTTYIPDGFSLVEVDADGNEIDQEAVQDSWDDVVARNEDEVLFTKTKLFTFFDPDTKQNYTVSERSLSLIQIADVEEPSQHDWIGGRTYRKEPAHTIIDYRTNPWASHERDNSTYRYEFREPIAEPADRAGQAFLGNLAERVAYGYSGKVCGICNILRASNGACFC